MNKPASIRTEEVAKLHSMSPSKRHAYIAQEARAKMATEIDLGRWRQIGEAANSVLEKSNAARLERVARGRTAFVTSILVVSLLVAGFAAGLFATKFL